MKILVTGGAGYIGSHTIIEILEKTDFEVISVDNFSNSTPHTFDRIEEITGIRVNNYNIDLVNLEFTKKLFTEHPDISGIIHFAALKAVGESMAQPLRYYNNNINSLINLLTCFDKAYFIFSSSCTVYGNFSSLPVTEQSPVQKPESVYGITKLVGEYLLEDHTNVNRELNSISLRYFNPVGAHQSGLIGEIPVDRPNNLVPIITKTAAGITDSIVVFGDDYQTRDGTCIRDYVHVSDIAYAHLQALQFIMSGKYEKTYEVFNLGTGQGVTVLEMITAFEKTTGIKLNYKIGERRAGDIEAIYSDSSKAKELLGWEPDYGIEDMMLSAWKWQQHLDQDD